MNDYDYDKNINIQPAKRGVFAYQEILAPYREQSLDELRQRVIRNLYNAAVRDERYPVSKPKLTLSTDLDRFGGAMVTVKATVETL